MEQIQGCATGIPIKSNVTIRILENGGLVEQRHYKNTITELFAKGLAAFTGGMFRSTSVANRTAQYTPMTVGVGSIGITQPTTPEDRGSFTSDLVYRDDAYPQRARLITFQDTRLKQELRPPAASGLVNLRQAIGAAPAAPGRKQANTYGVILTTMFSPGQLNQANSYINPETQEVVLLPVGITEIGLFPATRQGETWTSMDPAGSSHPKDLLAGIALTPNADLEYPEDPEAFQTAWDEWNKTPPDYILLKPNQTLEVDWFIGFFPSSLFEFDPAFKYDEIIHTKVADGLYYRYPKTSS